MRNYSRAPKKSLGQHDCVLPNIEFEKADIMCTRGAGGKVVGGFCASLWHHCMRFLTWLILWGAVPPGAPKARAGHTGMLCSHGGHQIIESTWPCVIATRFLAHYLKLGRVIVYRRRGLDNRAKDRIIATAMEHIGEPYGGLGLIWQGLRGAVTKLVGYPIYWLGLLFRRRWTGPGFKGLADLNLLKPVYCSQLVAEAFSKEGLKVTERGTWRSATPHDIELYCRNNPDQFKLIYDSEVKG